MPLNELFETSKETIKSMKIEQLVAIAGGAKKLNDNTETQKDLRDFFLKIEPEKLEEYSNDCINDSFENSGFVLQDIVNEIGRRLNFRVENGLYRGTINQVGYDGIWHLPNYDYVIEVKTTSKFSIRLETIDKYRNELIKKEKISSNSSTLFVVGRKDTLSLEQQIRGSKFSDSMRIIGLESLIKLMKIFTNSFSQDVEYKIQEILKPEEYTRVDNIVDIVFSTSLDKSLSDDINTENNEEDKDGIKKTSNRELIKLKRLEIAEAFSKTKNTNLLLRKTALFSNFDNSIKAAISISKRYEESNEYWFSYYEPMRQFLSVNESFMIFGLLDKNYAFVIPKEKMEELKTDLNTTPERDNKKQYWHIIFKEVKGETYIWLPKKNSSLSLKAYKLSL